MSTTGQPIIRGVQAVGGVDILYRYNSSDNTLPIPSSFHTGKSLTAINTKDGIKIAGFRLDGEFLRAVQQIASSQVIPILGGGGVALTNNNRTGTLQINATKVSTPDLASNGKMLHDIGFGPIKADDKVYDLTFIAQIQQGQDGGDSVGATFVIAFDFCGKTTLIQFDGCTIGGVDPVGLSGNDAVNYNVSINYLSWEVYYDQSTVSIQGGDASSKGSGSESEG